MPETLNRATQKDLRSCIPAAATPLEDFRADGIQLRSIINKGGYAVVYNGEYRGSQAAIKLSLEPGHDIFHNEISVNKALQGKSNRLVGYIDHGIGTFPNGKKHQLLILEHVADGSVHDQINRGGALHAETALRYTRQTAEGLHVMHAAGFVHRDVKPANILVSGSDVKLADFGVSMGFTQEAMQHPGGDTVPLELDKTGFVVGTPLYVAPEQAMGETGDPRSDVFELALSTHEMLVGEHFRNNNSSPKDQLEQVVDPVQYTYNVDKSMRNLVQHGYSAFEHSMRSAVHMNPDMRPNDPRDFAQDLADRLADMREDKGKLVSRRIFVASQPSTVRV